MFPQIVGRLLRPRVLRRRRASTASGRTLVTHSGVRRPYYARGFLESLEPRIVLSAFYDLSLVTATSQQTTDEDIIGSIDPFVSINDSAKAAYVATLLNASDNSVKGTAVIVDDDASAPQPLNANPSVNQVFAFPQINNAGTVAVRDRTSGSPPESFIRMWDSNNPGIFNNVAGTTAEDPYDIVTLPTINNIGGVAFIGFTQGSSVSDVYHNPSATRGQDNPVLNVTGSGGLRPMLSDDDNIVLRTGTDTDGDIKLIDAGVFGVETIASTSSGHWRALGNSPGISDDGQVVVFYGDLSEDGADAINAANGDHAPIPTRHGPGVFASIQVGAQRHTVRVAGSSHNFRVDPGERLPNFQVDLGPDFNFDGVSDWEIGDAAGPAGFHGFSTTSRIGVTNLQPFAVPAKGSYATVVYHANDAVGTTGPAIYTSRINIFNDPFGNPNSIGVEAPIQVAKKGQNVPGLIGTIQDVALYDPINNDGQIAFWASTATGQAIVRAAPKPVTTRVTEPGTIPPAIFDRPHFDPDSPLVEYVVEGVDNGARTVPVNQIIIHATGGFQRGDLDSLATKHSVHYYVTREGRVTQMIRESDIATHAGTPAPNANNNSIGIELEDANSHRTDPNWVTSAQLKKTALLVRDIARRYGILGVGSTEGQIPHLVASTDLSFIPGAFEREVSAAPGTTQDIDTTHEGVLAHGQVFRRSAGKDDPANFPSGAQSPVANPLDNRTRVATYHWSAFMAMVNNGIAFRLNSPANLLITDPQGRRVGVVPGTGQTVNEIPGASFTGPGTEPQSLAIPGGIDGQYQVQVVGTGNGVFHLDVYAASRAGELLRTQVADMTSAGATISYTLNYTTQVDARATVMAAANLPPVAFNDRFITRGEAPVQMPVLVNDSDPEGLLDAATVAITDFPDSGTTSIDPITGMITYTPNPGFVGIDVFQYEVRDTASTASNAATVSVHVLRQTQFPVAVDDERTTSFDTPIVIDVLTNDSDPDGALDPTTVELAHDTEASNGFIDIDAVTGQITYTPNAGFTGTDTFEYTVLDNDSAGSNAARVTVAVAPPVSAEIVLTGNGAPIVDGDTTPDLLDHTDFGVSAQFQAGLTRTFTVRNVGSATLTLGPLSVPAGFTLVEPLAATLAPGAADTFAIQLDTQSLGNFRGAVSFASNDPDENPFDFTIAATVGIVAGSLDLTFGGGDGWVTTDFNSGGFGGESVESVVIQPDGKILVGGGSGHISNGFALARYDPNGSLDTTFGGGDGFLTTGPGFQRGRKILLLPDGRIVFVGLGDNGRDVGIAVARYNADGALDTTFGPGGKVIRLAGSIFAINDAVLQSDGKIVVVGINAASGSNDFAVARLNANGTVDTSFAGGDGLAITDFGDNGNDGARGLVLQPDGKIVVAGHANGRDFGVARYNTDGTLDFTFGSGGLVVTGGIGVADDVLLQPDGRIVVLGSGADMARYNTDGSLDTTFGGGDGIELVSFPDGHSEQVQEVVVQTDGKLVVVGYIFVPGERGSRLLLVRYNSDGTLDTGFGSDGRHVDQVGGPNVRGTVVALQPDGKVLIAGGGGGVNTKPALARYHGDAPALPTVTISATDAKGAETGSDHLRFTMKRSGPLDQPLTILFQLQNDGVGGQATLGSDFRISTGSTQVTIPAGAASVDIVASMLLDAVAESDELVTVEIVHSPDYAIGLPFIADGIIHGECDAVILNGQLDTTFGRGDGFAVNDFEVFPYSTALALLPDGKMILVGNTGVGQHITAARVSIARYRANGTTDPSFDSDGFVITPLPGSTSPVVAVQPDGKVIAAGAWAFFGSDTKFGMARYLPNGAIDTTFGGGDGLVETSFAGDSFPVGLMNAISVQPDGKILLAGGASPDSGFHIHLAIARYNADGSLDATFGGGSGQVLTDVSGQMIIRSLALQPDGKIVAVASDIRAGFQFDPQADNTPFVVARYNTNGILDPTFGGGTGFITVRVADHAKARDVALQPDGKILVAGLAIIDQPTHLDESMAVLARYNADGTPDTSFGAGDGLVLEKFVDHPGQDGHAAMSVIAQSDGKIVIAGFDDDGKMVIARYNTDGTRDESFGGGDGMVFPGGNAGIDGFLDAALQPDGKLVITGTATPSQVGSSLFNLTRLTGDCVVAPPAISGVTFEDLNGNGVKETGEQGLPGWEIRAYADLDRNGHLDANDVAAGVKASDITNSSGEYELSFLPDFYLIVEVPQPAWTQSFPANRINAIEPTLGEFGYAVSLNFGQTSIARDFGNFPTTTNQPPALNPIANRIAAAGQTTTFTAIASDPDLPANDLAFSFDTGAPDGAIINSATGEFSWTPSAAQAGQTFDITVRVTDDGIPKLSDTETFRITVAGEGNQPPVLDSIADRNANVGQTVTFTATASDPDEDQLTFSLHFGAPAGATISSTGQFAWTPSAAQAGQTFEITVRVADDADSALSDSETFSVTVQPLVEPQFTMSDISGPNVAVPGQLRSYFVTFTDPNSVGGYMAAVNWGDGTIDSGFIRTQSSGGVTTGVVSFWHTYTTIGDGAIRLTLRDGDGNEFTADTPVTVQLITFQPDPLDASRRALVAGGLDEVDDFITFNPDGPGINVMYRDYNHGQFVFDGSVIAFGQGGNDTITVHPSIFRSAMLFGQAGNDQLIGGSGSNVLVGGAGNDTLLGSAARDLLFGGLGADVLLGHGPASSTSPDGDDLLASDFTVHEFDAERLASLFHRWTSAETYADRLHNLRFEEHPALNNTTVFDDFELDHLTGGQGHDWFVFLASDLVTDPEDDEEGLGVPFKG